MTKLSVNINKVALLRNSRGHDYPNVPEFAEKCITYGADGITLHPRPDQRHARYSDVVELRRRVRSHRGVELNVEGNPTPEFLKAVKKAVPHQCTLVPDNPKQLTSDHGWNLKSSGKKLKPIIRELTERGIRVSLFVDADSEDIERAKDIGANRVELYTEPYAKFYSTPKQTKVWESFGKATQRAQAAGLGVNAGHDLNLKNLGKLLEIPGILEVSIGHALIVDCLELGLEKTIKSYVKILQRSKA